MRYVFIINPVSGKGKIQKLLPLKIKETFRRLEHKFKICFTEYPGHAIEIAEKEAKLGDDVIIVACGGDGTLFEVVNGAYKYENAVVAPYPIGSGNDFVKSVGDKSVFLDVENITNGKVEKLDLIKFEDKVAINVASVGFDAHVADNMTKFKSFVSGKLAYILSVFYCLSKYMKNEFKLTFSDGTVKSGKYLFAAIANGRYYGGGFMPAPEASMNDGLLDIVEIFPVPKFKVISLIKKYTTGEHTALDICKMNRMNKIRIETNGVAVINLDGEIIYKKDGVAEFEVIPQAINVMMPTKKISEISKNKELKEKVLKST